MIPEHGATGGSPSPPPAHPPGPPRPPGPVELANVNIVNEYNSFNLASVTPPVAPKWKTSETLLDDFCKFKQSCQRIFDGPMCHITSGKIKTSMLLIWAGPDGEDIYENFNLLPNQKYDVDYVLRRFEEFCEPICNFRMARFKFAKVHNTMVNQLMYFITEFSRLPINVSSKTWMIKLLMPLYFLLTASRPKTNCFKQLKH